MSIVIAMLAGFLTSRMLKKLKAKQAKAVK